VLYHARYREWSLRRDRTPIWMAKFKLTSNPVCGFGGVDDDLLFTSCDSQSSRRRIYGKMEASSMDGKVELRHGQRLMNKGETSVVLTLQVQSVSTTNCGGKAFLDSPPDCSVLMKSISHSAASWSRLNGLAVSMRAPKLSLVAMCCRWPWCMTCLM
jgi:hypothetical protein